MSELPTFTKEYRTQPGKGLDNITLTSANLIPPGDNEVLVKIQAVSMQYRDHAIATGTYPLYVKDNVVPGSDCAGEVVAVGFAVKYWKKGDRVCSNFNIEQIYGELTEKHANSALGGPIDGVLTEYKVFPEHCLVKVPDFMSYEEASTLPGAALTAYNALNGPVPVKAGDYVLTQGTGGVSIFAVQIAIASGATVIATTSSPEKVAFLKSLGVEHVINYKEKPHWGEDVLKITGIGVDHTIELGGARTINEAFKCTKYAGWIHTIGFLAGEGEASNLHLECLVKNITLRGIIVGPRSKFEDMNRLFEAKKIRPVIDKVFPFEKVPQAFAYVQAQKQVGKVVIKL
ncbi:NAD-P-binding protein [Schizopora paradoxa]|uniref:NAD-P-binding protein n=1 Tax=Schizopora paradoxa TaxID=27342 RepID=A0A0H2S1K5_9AGAM|nr:NAD-P-binding protein [Schizopora paradoxa]